MSRVCPDTPDALALVISLFPRLVMAPCFCDRFVGKSYSFTAAVALFRGVWQMQVVPMFYAANSAELQYPLFQPCYSQEAMSCMLTSPDRVVLYPASSMPYDSQEAKAIKIIEEMQVSPLVPLFKALCVKYCHSLICGVSRVGCDFRIERGIIGV